MNTENAALYARYRELAQATAGVHFVGRLARPEQRQELMELSQQAFGSPQLMEQLARMDANLQALRPGEE
mgnify:CR=1 FL=1